MGLGGRILSFFRDERPFFIDQYKRLNDEEAFTKALRAMWLDYSNTVDPAEQLKYREWEIGAIKRLMNGEGPEGPGAA